ncbi:NepR family anti-sigma factor [Erythrobacter alti]|uniref:NepR family anti-sigma factor n=1 Tax=Erythrobacter alti TaxID=1896145 RepID=UPI0030F430AA
MATTPAKKAEGCGAGEADWTSGLKRLYDSVLDEPLPDSFKDLLSKLDENGAK